jgi:hypothetical protein
LTNKEIISWLLEGDVSIQYQTYRDLLDIEKPSLRKKIETEGWGLKFLSYRKQDGHWGQRFYQPKWTSSHYTLLDLKNLTISPDNKAIKETLNIIFKNEKGPDGGIGPFGANQKSDVCLNGMVLNYASYFRVDKELLMSVIDFLLAEKMADGGFNCMLSRTGATHSSLHTTLSVLEGILEYERNGYKYRLEELVKAKNNSHEFILIHKLFRSDKTGEIINPNFLKMYYPGRWYVKYDKRMNEAVEVILNKRTKDGLWKLAANHPGQTHFEMEKVGKPSRWNTLRALRVLKHYKMDE